MVDLLIFGMQVCYYMTLKVSLLVHCLDLFLTACTLLHVYLGLDVILTLNSV